MHPDESPNRSWVPTLSSGWTYSPFAYFGTLWNAMRAPWYLPYVNATKCVIVEYSPVSVDEAFMSLA